MSVSMKSSKSEMYAEIERLRFFLDQEEQKSQGLEEEIARMKKANQKPTSKKHSAVVNMADLAKAYCQSHGVKSVSKADLMAYANSKAPF